MSWPSLKAVAWKGTTSPTKAFAGQLFSGCCGVSCRMGILPTRDWNSAAIVRPYPLEVGGTGAVGSQRDPRGGRSVLCVPHDADTRCAPTTGGSRLVVRLFAAL